MFPKVFGCLEHTNNCYIFSIRGQNDRNKTKLTYTRGFRWIAGSTSNDSIRPSGHSGFGPPGPNPLADMDPRRRFGPTPPPNFPFKHHLYRIW